MNQAPTGIESSRFLRALFGNVSVTTPAVRAMLGEGRPVAFFSRGGWFYGHLTGFAHGNVFVQSG